MSTTDAVTLILQFTSILGLVVGGLYLFAGTPESLPMRILAGIAVLFLALILFALAEVIRILSDIRAVQERPKA